MRVPGASARESSNGVLASMCKCDARHSCLDTTVGLRWQVLHDSYARRIWSVVVLGTEIARFGRESDFRKGESVSDERSQIETNWRFHVSLGVIRTDINTLKTQTHRMPVSDASPARTSNTTRRPS